MVIVFQVELALCQVTTTGHLRLLAYLSFCQISIKSYLVDRREILGASFLIILRLIQIVCFLFKRLSCVKIRFLIRRQSYWLVLLWWHLWASLGHTSHAAHTRHLHILGHSLHVCQLFWRHIFHHLTSLSHHLWVHVSHHWIHVTSLLCCEAQLLIAHTFDLSTLSPHLLLSDIVYHLKNRSVRT